VGQLTGGIAHDFNNVLHAVQGALQLIRRVPQDDRVKDWADNALKSVKRGAELTSQLLTFARDQQLEPRPIAVSRLVHEMEDMVRRSLGPLVRLKVEATSDEAMVLADATQLEMALLNLAINARDAMPEGGSLTMGTKLRRVRDHPSLSSGEYVEVLVRDTGTGMDADVVARAFDPFFTTKGVGKGTGLGLSQVYGMARQAGGTAEIQSTVGFGTSVTVLLPRSTATASPSKDPSVTEVMSGLRHQSKILVVDDDPEVRRVLIDSLEVLGFQVVAAEDGPSGLRALAAESPDLMVVDFAMPGMNGAQLAELARSERPGLPIIFASGYADTSAVEAAAGVSSTILRKPFDINELEAALRALLNTRFAT